MNNTLVRKRFPILLLLFFISYGYFFQGGGWNQNTRICLTRAIIHDRTFIIDRYREDATDPPFIFVNSGDWAYYNGHYYTNKPPGLSFLSVIPFAATEFFFSTILPVDPEQQVHLAAYASSLCTAALCGALLCCLLFFFFKKYCSYTDGNSLILTVLFGFGTLVFSYSTTLYCHVPSAFFSFSAFVTVLGLKRGTSRNIRRYGLGAGFLASLAVLIEPSTVLTLLCTAAFMTTFKQGRHALLYFFLGCIPCAALQCYYNAACFGGPFSASYSFANDMVMWKKNGALFGLPRPGVMFQLLFSFYRGLFVSSPVLILALPGIVLLVRSRHNHDIACISAAVTVSFILFISGFYAWHGGSAAGPRYLLPAYPFLYILAAAAYRKLPATMLAVGCVSLMINFSITLVGNEIPRDIQNPLAEVVFKNVLEGNVSINPVPFSHFHNYPHITELARIDTWKPNFNSFNLGEALFPHSPVSTVPLFLFWFLWGVFWLMRVSTAPSSSGSFESVDSPN